MLLISLFDKSNSVISVKSAMNLTVVKVIKGTAGMVSGLIDQLSMSQILGCTYGDDTVLVVTSDEEDSFFVRLADYFSKREK